MSALKNKCQILAAKNIPKLMKKKNMKTIAMRKSWEA